MKGHERQRKYAPAPLSQRCQDDRTENRRRQTVGPHVVIFLVVRKFAAGIRPVSKIRQDAQTIKPRHDTCQRDQTAIPQIVRCFGRDDPARQKMS